MTKYTQTMTIAEANAAGIDVAVYSSDSIAELVAGVKSNRAQRARRGKSSADAKRITIARRAARAIKYGM